jgi:hypothetical protein
MSVSQYLESALVNLSASTAADVFLVVIALVLLAALREARKGRHSRFLEHAPNVMTSLGILGTFTGIVIGLLHFDPMEIDASIAFLLAGLKTAFLTSLVGIAAAIFFKAVDTWRFAPMRETQNEQQEVTPNRIYGALMAGNEKLDALQQSLAGAEEGSLVGQIKLARSEWNDAARRSDRAREEFADRLWSEMQGFAELLSKSATEQVIDALRQVIADFNHNLVEQFGDNFKRLDESVQRLVVWQQQYMEQLEQMSMQYAEGVKAIGETRDAVGEISARTAEIPESLSQLQSVIQVNQHQIQELQRHLEAFVMLRDKAVDAMPQIKNQLDEVGRQMAESAQAMQRVMLEGATEFKNSVTQTNTAMQGLANNLQTQSEAITTTLQDTATQINQTARDMLERLETGARSLQANLDQTVENVLAQVRQNVERTMSGLEREVSRSISQTGEGIDKQLQALDDQLSDQLSRVMNEMGRALATISSRFTSDYEQLVKAMQRVVAQQVD